MNYEYILREIKLSKLTGTPMSTKASKLVKFWDKLWDNMKIKIDSSKGEIKYWKDEHYYFHQNDKNDRLWCNHTKVWSFFRNELELDRDDIQKLIQYMMNKTLNCVVNTPGFFV